MSMMRPSRFLPSHQTLPLIRRRGLETIPFKFMGLEGMQRFMATMDTIRF